jgi:hypothetical protein
LFTTDNIVATPIDTLYGLAPTIYQIQDAVDAANPD